MQNRPYKILMSRGEIQIDSDELQKLVQSLETGNPVFFRRGGFNPSFYVGVVEDEKRWDKFKHDIHLRDDRKEILARGIPQLKSIFDETVLKLSAKR